MKNYELEFIRRDGSKTYLPGLSSPSKESIGYRCFYAGISNHDLCLETEVGQLIVAVRIWESEGGEIREKIIRTFTQEEFLQYMEPE